MGSIVAVAIVVAGVFYFTLPPTPPFHEAWSMTLTGNPSGQGEGAGGRFVTYTAVATPNRENPGSVNLTLTMIAINLTGGQVDWSSQPMLLSNVGLYFPEVVLGPYFAILVSTSIGSGGLLNALVANLSTGETISTWDLPLPVWGVTAASEMISLSETTLVTSYPLTFSNATFTPLRIEGLNVFTGNVTWQNSVQLPDDKGWGMGWGTGNLQEYSIGTATLLALSPEPLSGGEVVMLDSQSGAIRFQDNVSGPSEVVPGVVAGGAFFFLANSTGGPRIDGVNLSTGINTSSTRVVNVADQAVDSVELYSAGSKLIVASYSPSLSYTAYDPNGSEVWSTGFPPAAPLNASLLGCPGVHYPSIGPCDTLLSSPFLYGDGSSILLSAYPSELNPGTSYDNSYRLVELASGAIEWKSEYAFTFEASLPWTSPEPSFVVEDVIGTEIIYTVVASVSGTSSTAGGTL
jgi:hypothetical protein